MKSATFLGLALAIFCLSSTNAEIPPAVKVLINAPKASSSEGLYPFNLSSQPNPDFFRKNIEIRDGYIEAQAPESYGRLITSFYRRASPWTEQEWVCKLKIGEYEPKKIFVESKLRVTHLFAKATGPAVMLTVWAFANDGAEIHVPNEYITGKVKGNNATVSKVILGNNPNTTLWKVTWQATGIQYELYLPANSIKPPQQDSARKVAEGISCRAFADRPLKEN